MNKGAIQKFAVWARRELINGVTLRARRYGITAENTGNEADKIINGQVLTNMEMAQRKGLIRAVREHGFNSVMDEAAYTWFNRFIALRYMEVNDYLPSHIRIFTNSAGEFRPEILKEAMDVNLPGLDMQQVMRFIERNENENLYRALLLAQCNAMNELLPYLFEPLEGWTALLLPDNILQESSILGRMISDIPEDDWKKQVQIVGWLYQYYNTEPKADVFAGLKKNIKINKDTIPAATQLFTPDWIVRYMVENSLGRLWIEHLRAENEAGTMQIANGHVEDETLVIDGPRILSVEQQLKKSWKYYLEEAEQEPEVEAQLRDIRKERLNLRPNDIKLIDPCMGSGHILVYAFDVLMQIYLQCGWTERDAAQSILKNNLYGIDIDKRAAQLAYFAIMMKARQYDRRILTREITPNLCAIVESNGLNTFEVPKDQPNFSEQAVLTANYLIQTFTDARELGSIINVEPYDYDHLLTELDEWSQNNNNLIVNAWYEQVRSMLPGLVQVAKILSQKYDVACTNPPYMGDSGMSPNLSVFVKSNYPDTKTDMSTVFMEKTIHMCKEFGYISMINIPVWMSISSYEVFRKKLLQNNRIVNMLHFGRGVFGADFGSTSFTIQKSYLKDFSGTYLRLFTKPSLVDPVETKEKWFFERKRLYVYKQDLSFRIPGQPIAYWFSEQFIDSFHYPALSSIAEPKVGLQTGENNRFIRLWFECDQNKVCYNADSIESSVYSGKKWFPYNKGGEYRKWYGNNDYVVNWENDGYEIRHFTDERGKLRSVTRNPRYYFQESITWSKVTIGNIAFRYKPMGHIFDVAGTSIFTEHQRLLYLLGFCNSTTALEIATLFSPSMNYEVGHIAKFPVIVDRDKEKEVIDIVEANIGLSTSDWDSFETSWNFEEHPMVRWSKSLWDGTLIAANMDYFYGHHPKANSPLELCWLLWQGECGDRFKKLKANEENLNRIFIDIYGLQNELTPEVTDDNVTVRRADLKRDIISLISYAVGCMFGRYSLDKDGVIFAGGNFNEVYGQEQIYLSDNLYMSDHLYMGGQEYNALISGKTTIPLTYKPDKDNILPICDDEYFEDDIVGRFVKWVEVVFGTENLESNLQFIANALGGSGTSRQIIRRYFLNDFFKDHCSTYSVTGSGKRPIYWLFDAGKKNSFKALIYMHRYEPNLISKLRTDYVHVQQQRLEIRISQTDEALANETRPAERKKLNDQLKNLREQETELRKFEEKIHHLADQRITIDLDDGVKVNHAKFGDVLAPIK